MPAAVGVPESRPELFNDKPGGRKVCPVAKGEPSGFTSVQVSGGIPPVAVNVAEYDLPTTPSGGGAGVMLSAGRTLTDAVRAELNASAEPVAAAFSV